MVAPVPIRQRWLTRHELREAWHVARPVYLVQGACDLCVLLFFVFFKEVKLGVHSIDKLLLLIVDSRPSLLGLLVAL